MKRHKRSMVHKQQERHDMTQAQFESEIRRLARRIQLLQEVSSGETKMRRINVAACTVVSHERGAHTRLIAPSGWKPRGRKR